MEGKRIGAPAGTARRGWRGREAVRADSFTGARRGPARRRPGKLIIRHWQGARPDPTRGWARAGAATAIGGCRPAKLPGLASWLGAESRPDHGGWAVLACYRRNLLALRDPRTGRSFYSLSAPPSTPTQRVEWSGSSLAAAT